MTEPTAEKSERVPIYVCGCNRNYLEVPLEESHKCIKAILVGWRKR